MREEGYYWVFGNKCFPEIKKWSIYYWDGNGFWNGGDDFSEDSFEVIDECKITKNNKIEDLNELIKYIELLELEPFTGWTDDNIKGYLTACTSIKKKAENLL